MRLSLCIGIICLIAASACRKDVPVEDEALMTLLREGIEVGDSVQILYSDKIGRAHV